MAQPKSKGSGAAPGAAQDKDNIEKSLNSKEMLKDLTKNKTKVRFTDRMPVEIIKETQFYTVGQKIKPHKTVGQALIDNGIAKKLKVEEKDSD
jgi:hypothetical protein